MFLRTFFTRLAIELTNFWKLFAISSSWYQTEIMASISLLTVVQSFDLSLFLIIPYKFSMGFKSCEFLGHSKTFILYSCNTFCTFQQNVKGPNHAVICPHPECNLPVSYNLMIDYMDVLVGIYYSRTGIERFQTTKAKRPPKHLFLRVLDHLINVPFCNFSPSLLLT